MEVQLTSDQKAFARRAVETGRLQSEVEAVQEALALWEERERQRLEFLDSLDAARAGAAHTEGSIRELISEVKARGRARLMAELADRR